jgi:hypothetical protein
MPPFEDDDEPQNYRYEDARARKGGGRDDSWDRDDPDDADITPDDLNTVRCTRCKKLIFEDSVRCPYCKHLQLEEEQNRKATWLTVTAIVLLVIMCGYLVFGVFDIFGWFRR